MSKNKKNTNKKEDDVLGNEGAELNTEETSESEKEGGALSEGVLDAFDEEVAPTDPLIMSEDDMESEEDDFDDDEEKNFEIDSGDYKPDDEW